MMNNMYRYPFQRMNFTSAYSTFIHVWINIQQSIDCPRTDPCKCIDCGMRSSQFLPCSRHVHLHEFSVYIDVLCLVSELCKFWLQKCVKIYLCGSCLHCGGGMKGPEIETERIIFFSAQSTKENKIFFFIFWVSLLSWSYNAESRVDCNILYVHYSTPPCFLICCPSDLHCVAVCWNWTQDFCNVSLLTPQVTADIIHFSLTTACVISMMQLPIVSNQSN